MTTTNRSAHVDTFARDRLPPPEALPEFVNSLPELQYPERLNCATRLIDDAVREGNGSRIAVRSDRGDVTYAELFERSNRIANVLVNELGVVPGNRVQGKARTKIGNPL